MATEVSDMETSGQSDDNAEQDSETGNEASDQGSRTRGGQKSRGGKNGGLRPGGRGVLPFSPRHGEANRLRTSPRNKSQSEVPSSSNIVNSGPPLPLTSRKSTGHKRIQECSQQAVKKLKRLSEATKSIVDMHQRKHRGNSSGVIKSIKLYNFMCHKTFYQEWHENLNFIIGENGSGKSALLSGLMIGLGGKALSTARTSSVKDLIKTGETHAKTEVALLNKGKLPIETYGDQITVQRIINSSGQSTYKLQYGMGSKFKPATKIELDTILRSLDIQLENPVVILNQEYARSFLRSKDPKDKYKLFEDGAGTGECDRIRFQVNQNLVEIDKTLEAKETELEGVRRTYKDCEERVKIVEGITSHRTKLKELDVELKWYYVHVEEQKEADLQTTLGNINSTLSKNEETYKKALQEKKDMVSKHKPSDEEKAELITKKQDCERRLLAVREEMKTLHKERVQTEMKLKTATTNLPKRKRTATNLEEKVRSTEQRIKDDREKLLQKYQEQKEQLDSEIRDMEQRIQRIEEDKSQYSEGLSSLRRQIETTKAQRETIKSQIATKERALTQLRTSNSSLFAYGAQMESLVNRISASQKRFSQRPRGPLGSCFTVKDPKYLKIIQYVLRNVLYDFTVDNSKDAAVLTELINQVYGPNYRGRRPSIHTVKFHAPYDHSRTNCSKGISYPSLLDMLEFDNNDHIVMNTLLDVNQIERILLFKDPEEALKLLSSRETVPKYCHVGYTLDFYKIMPDPNLRCDFLNQPRTTADLVKTSHKQQIRTVELELATLKDELSNFVVDQEMIDEERKLRQQDKKCDDLRREKQSELNVLKQRYQSLKEPPNRQADLASVMEELEDVRGEIRRLEGDLETCSIQLTAKKDALAEKEALKRSIDGEVQQIQDELTKLADQRTGLQERLNRVEGFAARYLRMVEKNREERDETNARISFAREKIQQAIEAASAVGERVPVNRGSSEIKKEHDEIKARIEHLEKFADRHESIRERYEAVKKRYTKYNTDMKMVTKMHKKVRTYFKTVNIHYLSARDRVTQALTQCYEEVAKARKYFGKIKIDHTNRELFYLICPDKESLDKIISDETDKTKFKSKMVEYAAGLSGGERSFSTICFIIAMWQAMKSPFYMLDEFDVFMDAQNRTVSQEALMTHAKTFPNNQFFFFTPLDLTSVPSKTDALILRLYPPERNGGGGNHVPEDNPDPDILTPSTTSRKRGRGQNCEASASKTVRR